MTAKTLEEEAREYATRIRPCKYKIIDYDKEQPKRWREVYEAYLTAATLRDKEIEELRARSSPPCASRSGCCGRSMSGRSRSCGRVSGSWRRGDTEGVFDPGRYPLPPEG